MKFSKSELDIIYQYAAPTKAETLAGMKEIVPMIKDLLTKAIVENAIRKLEKIPEPECSQFVAATKARFLAERDNYLENCFNDGRRDGSKLLSWEECRRKLIFLDGFDELLNMLIKETDINSYREFAEFVEGIAEKYKIHFVVTSRINAVTPDDCNQPNAFEFAELSFEEQRAWCLVHKPDYWNNYLHGICESTDLSSVNDNLNVLLKIPYIFRMVAEHEYVMTGIVKNRAALFTDLFSQTMGRAKRHRKEKEFFNPNVLNSSFQGLAYDIWCDNCDSAERSEENKQLLLLTYYVKENDTKGRISFYHKSFYDYFLSLYFYNKLKESIKDESPDIFLEKLAERRLEPDILEFISELKENDEHPIEDSKLKLVLDRIEESECMGIDTKNREDIKGNAETMKYERCNNIFVNSLNTLFCFDIVRIFNELKITKKLMGKFSCSNLRISNDSEKVDLRNCVFQRADFSGANLVRADLNGADLSGANLMDANLSEINLNGANLFRANLMDANLNGANLVRADLYGANLIRADLSGADLSGADLSEADLIGADLIGANLIGANLIGADLIGADFSGADLSGADLSEAKLTKEDYEQLAFRGVDLSGVCIVE